VSLLIKPPDNAQFKRLSGFFHHQKEKKNDLEYGQIFTRIRVNGRGNEFSIKHEILLSSGVINQQLLMIHHFTHQPSIALLTKSKHDCTKLTKSL